MKSAIVKLLSPSEKDYIFREALASRIKYDVLTRIHDAYSSLLAPDGVEPICDDELLPFCERCAEAYVSRGICHDDTKPHLVNIDELLEYFDLAAYVADVLREREDEQISDLLVFAKVRPDAIIPTRDIGNAGFDIYANFPEDELVIRSGETKLVPTGIASAMGVDWYLQVEERGSTGSKGIKKSAGVIDSSYRGEIFVAITNSTNQTLCIVKEGHKPSITSNVLVYPYEKAIAQLVLHRVHNEVPVTEMSYDDLQRIPSDRGVGALGSTGK